VNIAELDEREVPEENLSQRGNDLMENHYTDSPKEKTFCEDFFMDHGHKRDFMFNSSQEAFVGRHKVSGPPDLFGRFED